MATTTKRRGRPATSERDDTVVRLDRQVAAKLRYVAENKGVSMAEFVTDILRPVADREFERTIKGN